MSLTMKASLKQILDLEEYSAGKVAMAASQGSLMGGLGGGTQELYYPNYLEVLPMV